jgi:hypothetical protein
MNKISSLLLSTLLIFSVAVNADIYKFLDENGNVVFTDHPEVGAEKIEKQELQTISAQPVRKTVVQKNNDEPISYTAFVISSPKNEETVRGNNGLLNVELNIEPSLKTEEGHKVTILLDGKAVGEPSSTTSFTLNGIDRGEHIIAATITDKKGNEVAAASAVTVYFKRVSVLLPKPSNTPAP